MPRPRILGSWRSKPRAAVKSEETTPEVVTVPDFEEPDCEIIKIEEREEESTSPMKIAVHGVTGVQFCGSKMMLQLIPNTSNRIAGNAGSQSIVMVMPVGASTSQVLNPTLCTVQKIENPTEITQIRQVVGLPTNAGPNESARHLVESREKQREESRKKQLEESHKNQLVELRKKQLEESRKKQLKESRKKQLEESRKKQLEESRKKQQLEKSREKLVQTIFADNSAKSQRLISESRVSGIRDHAVNPVKPEARAETSAIDNDYPEPSTSGFALFGSEGSRDNVNPTETEVRDEGESRDCRLDEFPELSETSGSERLFDECVSPVKPSAKTKRKMPRISSSESSNHGANLQSNERAAIERGQSVDEDDSIDNDDQPISQRKKLPNSDDRRDDRENSRSSEDETLSTVKAEKREENSWKFRCIVCNKNPANRTQLRRHATLCELCSDSLLTHGGLRTHRDEKCGSEISEIVETIVIEDDEDSGKSATESSPDKPAASSRKISSQTPNRKRTTQTKRSSGDEVSATYPKVLVPRLRAGPVASLPAKLQIRRASAGVKVHPKRRRGRPLKKTKSYAEKEVINYPVKVPVSRNLGNVELKKLVVPLARLEGPTLARYLEKRAEKPISTFREERFDRKKRRRKIVEKGNERSSNRSIREPSRKNYRIVTCNRSAVDAKTPECNADAREESDRSAAYRSDVRSVDSDTDENSDADVSYISVMYTSPRDVCRVIGVEADDIATTEKRPFIRKLTSPRDRDPEENSLASEELALRRSVVWTGNSAERSESAYDSIEEFDPEEHEDIPRKDSNLSVDGDKDRRQMGADLCLEKSAKKSVTRRTYFPSKRKVARAKKTKRLCDEASRDVCLMCKQLFALMRQLAGQFVGDRANKISVKCPLCSLYFISMFFLKKHVANNHLQCQSERQGCRDAVIAPVAGSAANDAALDCETEVALALECRHCRAEFSEDKDLVEHVYTQHEFSFPHCPLDHRDLRRIVDDAEAPSTSRGTDGAANNRPEDRRTADNEELLKQLLSDYSTDDQEASGSSDSGKPVQPSTKESGEPDRQFDITRCDICRREFSHSQGRLRHSLEHEFDVTESAGNACGNRYVGVDDPFADSSEYGWTETRSAEPATLEPRAEESGSAAPITEPMDDIFASGEDYDEFSPSRGGETKRKAPFFEISATDDEQPLRKKVKALQQLLENDEGIACAKEPPGACDAKLPIECSKCNRKFPNQKRLNEHLFFLHDDSLKDTVLTDVVSPMSRLGDASAEPRQWRCDMCSHNFKSYSRHRYFVHGDDEFVHVCENCCKVLTTVTMVNVHICTDVASYNCRTCNETFATGLSLRLHNMYKHKETAGPHVCRPCDKRFLTDSMLQRHVKWKHRFLRPYRPRKSSPVRMATPDESKEKIVEKLSRDNRHDDEMDSGCDQEFPEVEYEFAGQIVRKLENFRDQGQRSRSKNHQRRDARSSALKSTAVAYIKEDDLLQCNVCRLFCLKMSALRSHQATCHRTALDLCRVCGKRYPRGKIVRHMIDRHVKPCESYATSSGSIWNLEGNVEEKDAEELIEILGITRFISLCEYQRFGESSEDEPVVCPTCGENLRSREAWKFHFLERHDAMCALCNIEFKSGDKAAAHKIEDHGSMESYVWFADEIVAALTAATNFNEAAEKSFIEMISRDSDDESDESRDENEESKNDVREIIATCGDVFASGDEKDGGRRCKSDRSRHLEEAEVDGEKLVVVVNDEDIVKFGIGTSKPNVWGLASKISSTTADLTPTDVKAILESHFER